MTSDATTEAVIAELTIDLHKAKTRIRELEQAVGGDFIAPTCFDLTHKEEQLLGALMALPRVSKDQAALILYDEARRRCDGTSGTIRAYIVSLRAKLRPFSFDVITHFGKGWSVPQVHKDRIRAMTAAPAGRMG